MIHFSEIGKQGPDIPLKQEEEVQISKCLGFEGSFLEGRLNFLSKVAIKASQYMRYNRALFLCSTLHTKIFIRLTLH